MSVSDHDALVAELAQRAVADAAPQELPLFRAVSRRYLRSPEGVLRGAEAKDELLGFGVETAATLLTPVALTVASSVLDFVVGELVRTVKDASPPAVRRLLRLGSSDSTEGRDDALSQAQLRRVREIAVEKASALALPREQAELLADAMVGRLTTAAA